jgi:protein-disulfide isomerase
MPLLRLRCCSASDRLALALVALWCGAALCATAAAADPSSQSSTQKAPEKQPAKSSAAQPPSKTSSEKTPAAKKPEGTAPARKRRIITVGGGQIALDIRHWPLLGKPDAKYVFVEMFDYTCPYCRATHQAVRGAIDHFGDDLAILALPVPLDATCNRTVGVTAAEHAEACEIAKIAVAVWRVNRKQFAPFHSWLFEPAYRRTAAEARQHAAELVGENALRDELNLPHAANYILKHVELYERVGGGTLPKFLFPNSTVSGSVEAAGTLIDMISREGIASP